MKALAIFFLSLLFLILLTYGRIFLGNAGIIALIFSFLLLTFLIHLIRRLAKVYKWSVFVIILLGGITGILIYLSFGYVINTLKLIV